MESRLLRIFLRTTLVVPMALAGMASPVIQAEEIEQVVRPEIERREVREADIDTENFEIGAFAGFMNVEDFGTNAVYGARIGYHVTEYVLVEASYGRTETEETSAERFSGFQILADDDRTLDYWNASFAFNLLPGESFIGKRWAFTSDFFLIGGAGSTSFAGEDMFTWSFGFGYKVLANDWLALRVDARDHIFELDLLGERQTNHNLEFTAGLSVFF